MVLLYCSKIFGDIKYSHPEYGKGRKAGSEQTETRPTEGPPALSKASWKTQAFIVRHSLWGRWQHSKEPPLTPREYGRWYMNYIWIIVSRLVFTHLVNICECSCSFCTNHGICTQNVLVLSHHWLGTRAATPASQSWDLCPCTGSRLRRTLHLV